MGFTKLNTHNLISHEVDTFTGLDQYKKKILSHPSLSLPLEETLEILDDLTKFSLGRFLLTYRGFNGYWTSYLTKNSLRNAPTYPFTNSLEKWLCHEAPAPKANQDRFDIFQQQLQKYIQPEMKLASIPCGLMDNLLTLEIPESFNVTFTGIDLDLESLSLARAQASSLGLNDKTSFRQKDAWDLKIFEEFDIIVSNALNIYISEIEKLIALYREFYQALKPEGLLITSFLTPPPEVSSESPWKNVSVQDLRKQKTIFNDILEARWECFYTEMEVKDQLKQAGFSKVLEVIYDPQGIYPTIVAQK